jgi:hypothetical protein
MRQRHPTRRPGWAIEPRRESYMPVPEAFNAGPCNQTSGRLTQWRSPGGRACARDAARLRHRLKRRPRLALIAVLGFPGRSFRSAVLVCAVPPRDFGSGAARRSQEPRDRSTYSGRRVPMVYPELGHSRQGNAAIGHGAPSTPTPSRHARPPSLRGRAGPLPPGDCHVCRLTLPPSRALAGVTWLRAWSCASARRPPRSPDRSSARARRYVPTRSVSSPRRCDTRLANPG